MHNVAFFVDLETQVWQALVNGDQDADQRLLAADFLGVYASGVCSRVEHVAQLQAGPSVAVFALSEARILVLSQNIVVLSYLAHWQRPCATAGTPPQTMYVSSIWKRSEGTWLNVFSQDTVALLTCA